MNLDDLHQALSRARYETARRIGLSLLAQNPGDPAPLVFALHDAYVHLGDFREAKRLLETSGTGLTGHALRILLLLAEDFKKLSRDGYFAGSDEARQGYTVDEYRKKYLALSEKHLNQARSLAETMAEKELLARFEIPPSPEPFSRPFPFLVLPPRLDSNGSKLTGRILDQDGFPAAGVEVTLGLKVSLKQADPAAFISNNMHYAPEIGPMSKLTAMTDEGGSFFFGSVPAGPHEFISVTLPEDTCGIRTRFLARDIRVQPGQTTSLGDLSAAEWQSAPARESHSPHLQTLFSGGSIWNKCAEWKLDNPFHYEFPRQLLTLPCPLKKGSFRVMIEPGVEEPHQRCQAELAIFTGLLPGENKTVAVYHSAEDRPSSLRPALTASLRRESGVRWILETGRSAFLVAGDQGPADTAPISSVKGPDGIWRGEGRFHLPAGIRISGRTAAIVEEGPLLVAVDISYRLTNGATWSLRLTALAGEPLLLVRESSDALEGAAFEFSLREFSGGRGFLHWTPETGSRHWSGLEPRNEVVGRLPESVPWWIPPHGFGYAMTSEGLGHQDYIGVFTRRRGEWIDRAFDRISRGPVDETGRENRELDWPYPEMVGSSISMITVHTSEAGDAFFRFGFFEGERQWALMASAFSENDGPFKEFGRLQHAFSSPRLQEFKDWHFDVPDSLPRPHVVAERGDLPRLRRKMHSPRFAGLWKKIRNQDVPGARNGLVFALEGDPLSAWYKRIELLAIADVRSKMTLLGRDFSDMYSPVGSRNITMWAEEYDLIAASGVFTAEEERRVRAFFILLGHLFMEEDLMNWRFNARNANFEADRTDIVAAIGLVFQGHPDSEKFLDHVIDRTKSALLAYCTPGSGKWYENPACYYLQASKCRMNQVYHLVHHGLLDLKSVPRLEDFLRWGLHLLTPPMPADYEVMRAGTPGSFASSAKVRKIPPIGDHAALGRWLPEHYAFIGKLFLKTHPSFGRELVDAYFCANADGRRLLGQISWEDDGTEGDPDSGHFGSKFGNLPLFFSAIHEEDLPTDPVIAPVSRRLEGFGAILRNEVNTDQESCLLVKQGPGGYRFHRSEGSFLLFAKGRPLIFDGGEAGETWRHSTLSFHDVHMPLSAGTVERYFDSPGFQFVQGTHPVILQPGEPVFLSDSCRHELVEESYRRHRIDPPAVVRLFAWIDADYLIVHDDLSGSLPELSHWHLQVVGDSPMVRENNHFRFPGRFGIDLEVVLPGQEFQACHCEPLPITHYHGLPAQWFSMQHLQLSRKDASHYLAVLRPVPSGIHSAFQTEALWDNTQIIGLKVILSAGTDIIWFRRGGLSWKDGSVSFEGSYGAFLERPEQKRLILMGPGLLKTPQATLRSQGPKVAAAFRGKSVSLNATGEGSVTLEFNGNNLVFNVSPSAPLNTEIV